MLMPRGDYRYDIRRAGAVIAVEQERYIAGLINGFRRTIEGDNLHEVEAGLDAEGNIASVNVRYKRGFFTRSATYAAVGESLRGSVSAVASQNEVVVKLGRYREIDADLVLFRALILAHIRLRGQAHWTGRVAVIDPNTLVAASLKQTCRRREEAGLRWAWEARMGDADEIELDGSGRIVRQRDSWGVEKVLADFTAPSC